MTPLSILDLSPVPEGSTPADALRNTIDLARHAERLGYRRFWIAEHHSLPGVASAATAVMIGQVAAATDHILVGSGGIMLPNHAPLVVAEQFGTLASLYPGRIELGLGRAPGSDQITARAMRRTLATDPDDFPRDVMELMAYFRPAEPDQRVVAVPAAGQDVPFWILGSSLFGAQLAAMLSLPFAFASHFAPDQMEAAIAIYRQTFRPSEQMPKAHLMLGLNVIAAETDEEARFLFTSQQQGFVNLRRGRPGRMARPIADYVESLDAADRALLERTLSCAVVGSPDTVRRGMAAFAERWGADELIITGAIHDHQKRLRSFEIAAGACA